MTPAGKGPFCPQCDQPATGNFCQNCGATLGGRFCGQCGSKVAPAAGFCNQCGNKMAGDGGGGHRAAAVAAVGGRNLPWWIAGVSMFVLILVVGMSKVQPSGPVASPTLGPAPAGGAPGTGNPPDLSQMTPIEAADRLFTRVMTAVTQGDSAQSQAFLPMAIAAYQRARPLNLDGMFHLSMLNRTAMNLEAALDNALEIVEQDPNHLLGLAAAAEAALELGLMDEAETHYRQIYEIFDEESQRQLEEYDMHSRILLALKDDAEAFLAGR